MVYTAPLANTATAAAEYASVAPATRTAKSISFDTSPVRHVMTLSAKQSLQFAAILDSGSIAVWSHKGALLPRYIISFVHAAIWSAAKY